MELDSKINSTRSEFNLSPMQLRRLTLSFTNESELLEEDFLDEYYHKFIHQVRIALLLAIVFYALFGILDSRLMPEMRNQLWFIRYVVFCPITMLILLFSFTKPYKKYMQFSLAFTVVLAGLGIVTMIIIAPPPVNYSYYAGLMLIFIFGYSFVRARFIWATAAGWFIVFCYEIGATILSDTPLPILINNNFFFISANIIGMISCYYIEYAARQDFFLTLELKKINKELQKAREIADESTKTKSSFLANMSHEIRTPMNSILGFLELVLEDRSLPELQREYLTTAHMSARSLLGLINDILDISKMESSKFTIERRPFSLKQLMDEIMKTMDIATRKRGVKLQFDTQVSISGSFVGDPLRLRQIIINLLGNAIKFTQKGSVCIKIIPAEKKGQLHFIIKDTGIGISPDRLSRIFDSFTQSDTSTTRKFGGTGLGTSIAKELVEMMGGRIWAESVKGKGSTFHFIINLPSTDHMPEHTDLFVVPGKAVLPGSRCGFRILLVEDVEANVDLARIRLEQQGHKITVAWNGRKAVEKALQGEIDVILMDVHMPEMDGIEATKHIRSQEADTGRHIPIIAMTAAVMKKETKKYFETGMDAVVAKPIDFSKLFKAMEKVVPKGVGEVVPEIKKRTDPLAGLEFQKLEGIDTHRGLNSWQDPEAYIKALLRFSNDYRNAATDLAHFIEKGEINNAFHKAHALKGVAGNLAIIQVADAASLISIALRENRIDDVKGYLSTLTVSLKSAINAIGQLETGNTPQDAPIKELNVPHTTELFIKMLTAFNELNPYIIEPFLSELNTYLSQEQLNPIVDCIEQFDFEGAQQETIKLTEILKLDLGKLNEKS